MAYRILSYLNMVSVWVPDILPISDHGEPCLIVGDSGNQQFGVILHQRMLSLTGKFSLVGSSPREHTTNEWLHMITQEIDVKLLRF